MDKGVILGGDDPSAGHHGELVDRDGMTPTDKQMQRIVDRQNEAISSEAEEIDPDAVYHGEDDEEGDDIGDPWHVIARDQEWTPEEIVAKREEVTGEVTAMMRDAARRGLAIGGLGVEMVMRHLIRRVFVGTSAMYPPGTDPSSIVDQPPIVECELFLMFVAEEQHRMLVAGQEEMRKAELSQPMVQGPGGLLVPGNRAQRRAETRGKGSRRKQPGE